MLHTRLLPLTVLLAAGTACKPGPTTNVNVPAIPPPPATTAVAPAAPAHVVLPRTPDDWHATDSIFKDMGGVQGRLIANLTVDDAHYTWKLLEAGARVLVVSPNAALLKEIEAKKATLKLPDDQLRTRLAPADSVGLGNGEVDVVLFTRTYSQVNGRRAFFTRLREATTGLHQVTIVDFLQRNSPMGPPMAQRMDPEVIMDELGACGFTDAMALSKQVPHRFVIVAQDFVEPPGQ